MITNLKSNNSQYVDILQNKVNAHIERNRNNVTNVLKSIEQESASLTDMLVPIGTDNKGQTVIRFRSNGVLKMGIRNYEYSIHSHAVTQSATKFGIPSAYLRKLSEGSEWERKLASTVLNNHQINSPRGRVLVRSVDNEVRGVLSDSYRRISSPLIYNNFLQAVKDNDAIVSSGHIDHTKSWLEAIIPKLVKIETQNNGDVYLVFGARLSNSDFGDGALEIRSFVLQAVCLNGLVTESTHRKVHLGKKLPNDIRLSEKTYQLESEIEASAVSDITNFVLSEKEVARKIAQVQRSCTEEIDIDNELVKLTRYGLNQDEINLSAKLLINSNPEDGVFGKPTVWKLSQAISAIARGLEPRRQREVEEVAGNILVMI